MSESAKHLLQTLRPPFLVLTPACVWLGVAAAMHFDGTAAPLDIVLVLVGALAAHASVNALNEYADFRSGLDLAITANGSRTPFSGGSGALVAHPAAAPAALWLGLGLLALVIAIGLVFLARNGLALLPIGLAGAVLVAGYTPWLNRNPWACLVAPGLGFGPLMVVGTYVALTGRYDWAPLVLSLVPFFGVNNLLLLNQFPDIEPDREAGRRHLAIAHGVPTAARVYALQSAAAVAVVSLGVILGHLPLLAVIALVPLALTAVVTREAMRFPAAPAGFARAMGLNVIAAVVTPVLLGAAIVLG